MTTKNTRYRLRFVPHEWTGLKNFNGYDPEGRFWEITPVMTKRMAVKWRSILHLFCNDIWFMELQVYRNRKWITLESWWPAPNGIRPPPELR